MAPPIKPAFVKMADVRLLLSVANRARVMGELSKRQEGMDYNRGWYKSLKKSSVLVPFIRKEDPELLFTVRAKTLSNHRGQVRYSDRIFHIRGGMMEFGDGSLTQTALRETQEELGISPDVWDVWGELPPIPDRVKGSRRMRYLISPVIAVTDHIQLETLRLQKSEVDFVFTVPVSVLMRNRHYTIFKDIPIEFPVYLGGQRKIWGITGFIIDYVFNTILTPSSS